MGWSLQKNQKQQRKKKSDFCLHRTPFNSLNLACDQFTNKLILLNWVQFSIVWFTMYSYYQEKYYRPIRCKTAKYFRKNTCNARGVRSPALKPGYLVMIRWVSSIIIFWFLLITKKKEQHKNIINLVRHAFSKHKIRGNRAISKIPFSSSSMVSSSERFACI